MARVTISSVLAFGAKLMSMIQSSTSTSSSSFENDLRWIMRTLERIQATLSDAEHREIRDESVKLWLKELKEVAYDAEDVLGEYDYEVMRAKVEARDRKRKHPSSPSSSSPLSIEVQTLDSFAERIKAIRSRFDDIADAREKLRLRKEYGSRRPDTTRNPAPTSHLIDYSNIFGREKEKEEVIDLLLTDHGNEVSVIAIVGKGGLGKTTLAQLVFNDPRVRQSFNERGWICVSEDFDVERITKAMIESVTGESCHLTELSTLQKDLMDKLMWTKVLFILDDVWNERPSLWEVLRIPLMAAKKAMILVTTRNLPVADIMRTVPPYLLGYLPVDQCWSLFQHYAFGGVDDRNEQPNLVEIGRQITRKCGGLPLAVKSLASLLRCDVNEESWRDILESDEWQSQEENEALAALEISYQRMPAYLKPCFRFFSMFPKDHDFVKGELFRLWMAHGYLQSKGTKSMEEIASEYVDELIERSFLDHHHHHHHHHSSNYTSYDKDASCYKMHDLIHDLARKTSGGEHFLIAGDELPDLLDGVCHLHVTGNAGLLFSRNLTALRTLVVDNSSDISCLNLAKSPRVRALVLERHFMMELPNSIRNLKNLRYLQLQHSVPEMVTKDICVLYNLQILVLCFISLLELPKEMGNLENLQYLKISYSTIEKTPESICLLSNLQILILNHCYGLHELPGLEKLVDLRQLAVCYCQIKVLPESICQLNRLQKLILNGCGRLIDLPGDIGNLRNLRELNLLDSGVECMPLGIHKLTALQSLKATCLKVRIGHNHGGIGLLRDLANLKGKLYISGLANLVRAEDAKNANLKSKCKLSELTLDWHGLFTHWVPKDTLRVHLERDTDTLVGTEMHGQILEFLQPHPNLKKLTVIGYDATTFPSWMLDPSSCASLDSISIKGCVQLRSLHFGNFSSVNSLTIHSCHKLQQLPEGSLPFRVRHLCIRKCPKLESLDGLQDLMSLERLDLSDCWQLQISPNDSLPAKLMAQHITIISCPRLTDWCQQHNVKERFATYGPRRGRFLRPKYDDDGNATKFYLDKHSSKEECGEKSDGNLDGDENSNEICKEDVSKLIAAEHRASENDLWWIIRTLERTQVTLSDMEEREIREEAMKLWLKELKEVAYDAEDVIGEYNYEVMRAKVDARGEATADSHKRKQSSSSSSSSPLSIKAQILDSFAERIKAIRSRFADIAVAREKLRLREEYGSRQPDTTRNPAPTSHLIDHSNIFGREKEKEEVIDLLLTDHGNKVSVIAIVGKGGLGKTTLAQLVFNDPRVCESFNERGWICVSEDFDVERLTKAMIESVTGNSCHLTKLSTLQKNLRSQVTGREVLFILDDVWNERPSLWEMLRVPLVAAKKAMILVTTRNVTVADIMKTLPPYLLGYLPEDQCWSLFQHYAFGGVDDRNEQPNLVEIGRQITRKCGGLPLAVKSLASLLRFDVNEDSWRDILESDEWQSQEENETLAALEISYQRMPTYLRPCFRFFSMFPKDHDFVKSELFRLWMAHGYLQSKGTKSMEEIAYEYVDELVERSFLDQHHHSGDYTRYGKDVSSYKMHDLIHDLARKTSGGEHFLITGDELPDLPDGVRHLHVRGNVGPLFSRNLTALRTLVFDNFSDISCLDLAKSPRVRALVLQRYFMMELPDSIRNLKNLRYLQLQHSVPKMVTKDLCVLYNLQILVLCFISLLEIPKEIENLENLRYLQISYSTIEKTPESICLLSALQILILNHCYGLYELPEGLEKLVDLRQLSVCHCQIKVLPESICQLNRLQKLILTGCRRLKNLPGDIGNLQNLQDLNLLDSGIIDMPLGIHKLIALESLKATPLNVRIEHNQGGIGVLRDLVNLKGNLCISGLANLVRAEDAKNANLKSKCKLSELTLDWQNYRGTKNYWGTKNTLEVHLNYWGTKNTLEVHLERDTDTLVDAEMHGQILEFLQPHPNLKKLSVIGYDATTFPSWMLDPSSCASLESISIKCCIQLRSVHFSNFSSVNSLTISSCHKLQQLPEGSLPFRIQHLCIFDCPELESLDGLQDLMSLERLDLSNCWQLQISPNNSLPAKLMAQHIMIMSCPRLTDWCQQHNIKEQFAIYERQRALPLQEYNDNEEEDEDGNAAKFYFDKHSPKEGRGEKSDGNPDGDEDSNEIGKEDVSKLIAAEHRSSENDLWWIIRTLERTQATLSDMEEREIREEAVKLWLKELKEVAYDAEDVIGEYNYEVMRAKVDARGEATADSHKRKQSSSSSSSSSPPLSIKAQILDSFAERIKAIRSRFADIAVAREKFRLREEYGSRKPDTTRNPAPTSHLNDYSNIFGREKEKEEVIDLLLTDHGNKVSVIAIVGKGGLGKTTLAQLVFNDPRVCQRFNKRGWICVSEDFDVEMLTKAMIESVGGNSCHLTELSTLQKNLRIQVMGREVLFILDDVWNERPSLWEMLRVPLVAAKKAMILVTTRNVSVADIMKTVPPYLLGYLPGDQCWSLFQHYAFGRVDDRNEEPNLVEIGRQIMRKCGGLPLAVKSLASLLRFDVNEETWRDILESDEWQSHEENETLTALEISYQRMPAYLRPCFRFFSMFPKDHAFVKDELFGLWMAHGYLQSKGTKSMKEIAFKYVDELIERSFLDHHQHLHSGNYTSYDEDDSSYKMHALIHDLARKTSGDEHFLITGDELSDLPDGVRHLHVRGNVGPLFSRNLTALRTLVVDNSSNISCLDLAKSPHVRALVLERHFMMEHPNTIRNLKNLRYLQLQHSVPKVVTKDLCVLYNLQILVLCFISLPELPKEIGNLENLRYLKISYSTIEKTPEFICLLSNLQILILKHCYGLHKLPKGLEKLIDLRQLAVCHCQIKVLPESICQLNRLQKLKLTGCRRLKNLPSDIGNLQNLQDLNLLNSGVIDMPLGIHKLTALESLKATRLKVRIGHNHGGIGLLRDLVNLKGKLWISGLANLVRAEDAKNANLKSKCKLSELTVDWQNNWVTADTFHLFLEREKDTLVGTEMHGQILEFLQPHPNLKKLTVIGYDATTFPSWMLDPSSCASLESISIKGCVQLRSLHFSNFSSVNSLTISSCHKLQQLPEGSLPFRIQHLCIFGCPELESLDGLQDLMSLERLDLSNCCLLQISPNNSLPAKLMAQHIMIKSCPRLTDWCQRHNIKQYTSATGDQFHMEWLLEFQDYDDDDEFYFDKRSSKEGRGEKSDGNPDGDEDSEEINN